MSELKLIKLIFDGSLLLFIVMIIGCVIEKAREFKATMKMCEHENPTVAKIATVQNEVSDE